MEIKKETGYFESFDGTRLYYEVRGEGQPLLFAYGIVCQMNHWIHQIEYFSKNYRVITFDYRGHHRSETPLEEGSLTVSALARDIQCLCEHLQIKNVPAFGHSMGVQVLIKAAAEYPELFSHLILVNGFASNPFEGLLSLDQIKNILHQIKELSDKNKGLTQKAWELALLNPLSIPVMAAVGGFNLALTQKKNIEIYLKGVAAIDFNVFISLFDDMLSYDGRVDLPLIEQPTLIFNGEKDGVTPVKLQIEMNQLLPNSRILRIPYGSHCCQLDFPDIVNQKSEKFFTKN